MNSISKNEMNIRISLCYVRCVNGQWNVGHFSGNRSEKDALTEKKIQNTWETIIIGLKYSILQCKEKFIALYRQ